VGSSDRTGAFPAERGVHAEDLLATMYHVLGIDHATLLHDRQGRPIPVLGHGKPIAELLQADLLDAGNSARLQKIATRRGRPLQCTGRGPEAGAMASRKFDPLLNHLRRIVHPPDEADRSDGELLGEFINARDPLAFQALVRRHGPMVFSVCRRVTGSDCDAHDAFQAVFLVLLRKATTIVPREDVGNWLYGVAYRTAASARACRQRRWRREQQVSNVANVESPSGNTAAELREVLDRELSRLPEKYRLPVVLCELEGRSRREVARQLGIPAGTLSWRLARARKLLAKRLADHGPFSGAVLAAALSEATLVGVPPALLSSVFHLAAGAVPANAAALAQGVIKTMFLAKLETVSWGLLLAVSVSMGAVGLTAARQATPAAGAGAAPEARERRPAPRPTSDELEALRREIESLRLDLRATKDRIKKLEERQPGPGVGRRAAGRDGEEKNLDLRDYSMDSRAAGNDQVRPPALKLTSAVSDLFRHRVPFEIGVTESQNGGAIEILEVRGTQPQIKVGGLYLVRGKYVLPSRNDGKLYFYLTSASLPPSPFAPPPAPGFGPVLDLQSTAVSKGEGEFTLIHAMNGFGYFHLVLEDGKSARFANVYFGSGDNVLRKKTW
jgi:RNA polymerase sigma factor (sigma-70 family)